MEGASSQEITRIVVFLSQFLCGFYTFKVRLFGHCMKMGLLCLYCIPKKSESSIISHFNAGYFDQSS